MKKLLALFAALVMIAVACGDDDGGGSSDSVLSKAIAGAIIADPSGDPATTEDQAQCMANTFIDTIGDDGLVELGVTLEAVEGGMQLEDVGLSDEQMQSYIDASLECIDVESLLTEGLVNDGMSEKDASCIADNLDPDLMSEFAGVDPSSNPDLTNEILDVMADCDVSEFG